MTNLIDKFGDFLIFLICIFIDSALIILGMSFINKKKFPFFWKKSIGLFFILVGFFGSLEYFLNFFLKK